MTAKPPSLPRPPRRRVLRFLLKAFAAILVVLLVWHVSFRIRTNNAIKRLEAKARANGEPWTLAELAATYYGPIPDEENAAIPLMALWEEEDPEYWKAVRNHLRPLPNKAYKSPPDELPSVEQHLSGKALTPEEIEATKSYLREQAARVQRLLAALEAPRARFPLDLRQGHLISIAHVVQLKSDARLLLRQALQSLDEGDTDAAARMDLGVFRVGELLREDPMLIAQLVRFAIQMDACSSLERLVHRGELDDAQLKKLMEALRSVEDVDAIKRTLFVERASATDVFHDTEKWARL